MGKKIRTQDQGKNIIAARLAQLRNQCGYSQRELADKLQLADFNVDKNLITRIEPTADMQVILKLKHFSEFFGVSYSYLLDGIPTDEDLEKYPDLFGKEGKNILYANYKLL